MTRALYTFALFLILVPLSAVFAQSLDPDTQTNTPAPRTHVRGGVMFMSPEIDTYSVGDVFNVRVLIDTGGEAVNAAEADLTFNKSGLEVESISRDGSILDAWSTEPNFSNGDGTIRFSGWTRKNFTGPSGLLLTIRFRALRNVSSTIRFATGAILDANDNGSNIVTSLRSAVFSIAPKELPPEQKKKDTSSLPPPHAPNASDGILDAPIISEYSPTMRAGERLIIKGSARPDSNVRFTIKKTDGSSQRSMIMSAGDGTFTFVSDSEAGEGMYHVSAELVDPSGLTSPPSQEINISATQERFAAAIGLATSTVLQLVPFLALLIVAGLGTGYLFHRHAIEKIKHAHSPNAKQD